MFDPGAWSFALLPRTGRIFEALCVELLPAAAVKCPG